MHALALPHKTSKIQDERGRQIVDDIVAKVLEGVHGHGLSRSAHARNDDDVRDGLGYGACAVHAVRSSAVGHFSDCSGMAAARGCICTI